jgi:hypothetical protein
MLGRGERHRVRFARTSRARFRDPAVAAATTREDVLAARRMSVVKATDVRQARRRLRNISIRGLTPGSLDPGWRSRARRKTAILRRSWCSNPGPKLLVWGEDEPFQTVDMPNATRGRSPKQCWF